METNWALSLLLSSAFLWQPPVPCCTRWAQAPDQPPGLVLCQDSYSHNHNHSHSHNHNKTFVVFVFSLMMRALCRFVFSPRPGRRPTKGDSLSPKVLLSFLFQSSFVVFVFLFALAADRDQGGSSPPKVLLSFLFLSLVMRVVCRFCFSPRPGRGPTKGGSLSPKVLVSFLFFSLSPESSLRQKFLQISLQIHPSVCMINFLF